MDAPLPGALGGTYAGNPLALASGLAVMDIIDSENLIERANTTGDKLRAALLDLAASTSAIAEVRGLGAMIAVEFHHPEDNTPNPELAAKSENRRRGEKRVSKGRH